MKSIKSTIILILFLVLPASTYAQEIVLGADFVSRYIWRGTDLGANAPALQPNVAIVAGGFTGGFWGSYSFSNEEALDEIDIYLSNSFSLGSGGSLSVGFTDYMNPNSGVPFSNFNNYDDTTDEGPGAHFIELNVGYSGPESFPISVLFNIFLYNVEKNPIYFQIGYNTAIDDVGLSFFFGGTNGQKDLEFTETPFYGVTEFDIINVGFTASKSIPVTESFSLPIFGSIILNPAADHLFYVVGLKL